MGHCRERLLPGTYQCCLRVRAPPAPLAVRVTGVSALHRGHPGGARLYGEMHTTVKSLNLRPTEST